jgi:hypothetical protein
VRPRWISGFIPWCPGSFFVRTYYPKALPHAHLTPSHGDLRGCGAGPKRRSAEGPHRALVSHGTSGCLVGAVWSHPRKGSRHCPSLPPQPFATVPHNARDASPARTEPPFPSTEAPGRLPGRLRRPACRTPCRSRREPRKPDDAPASDCQTALRRGEEQETNHPRYVAAFGCDPTRAVCSFVRSVHRAAPP